MRATSLVRIRASSSRISSAEPLAGVCAWGEWRCTCAHGPASDALRESGIPFAAPAHGKSVPDVGVSDRRWLFAAVWARIQHGTCSPIWNGIGSGKALSLILLIVGHQATGGGFYSGNGRTSSSLTG